MCYILRKNQKAMYSLLTTFSALHFCKNIFVYLAAPGLSNMWETWFPDQGLNLGPPY